ncbi:MAG: hypothetical protein IPP94_17615 [Ignavibacteria bacterium]|nr:hypothetical protein [Ignavibacteria bacterium]
MRFCNNCGFVLAIAAGLCAGTPAIARAQFVFVGEYIDFTLTDSVFHVAAVYRFANAGAASSTRRISYPFKDDVKEIRRIVIVDVRTGMNIPFEPGGNMVVFPLTIMGNDSADVLVRYEQQIRKDNVYLLTTTQQWGAPLRYALYTLTASSKLSIAGFSYEPDRWEETPTMKKYSWTKADFLPLKDFVVTLKEGK